MGKNPEDVPNTEIARMLFPSLAPGGPHAYGYLTSRGVPGSVTVAKYAGRCDTKPAWEHFGDIDPEAKIVMLHSRWATHGSPLDVNNNHPVRHGNIVGAHNGVLSNHERIMKVTGRWTQSDGGVGEVDSEAIFAAVNRWGHSRGLRRVRGNMATTYLDLRKPHICVLARSEGRPLQLGWTEKGNIFWASERKFLLRLESLGIKFTKFSGVQDYRMLVVKEGKIIFRHTYDETFAAIARIVPVEPSRHPLRFDPRSYVESRRAREVAVSRSEPRYGPEWAGTALAAPKEPQSLEERNGPALASYLRSIEAGQPDLAKRVAAAAEVALVEKRGPIGDDEGDERYFFNGAWLSPEDYVNAVADAEGWGDDPS